MKPWLIAKTFFRKLIVILTILLSVSYAFPPVMAAPAEGIPRVIQDFLEGAVFEFKTDQLDIFDFDNNFVGLLQEADLCITRAGASTLAELSVSNTPFIAVPLPTSKDNHQFENAHFYKRNNCCWIIEQNNFEKKIEDLLIEIIINKLDYLKKKENLEKLNYQNNWYNVNQKIIKTINEN